MSLRHLTTAAVLVATACFGGSHLARAQNPDFTPLDRYLDTLEHHDRAMGVLHILSGDSTIYSRALGLASVDPPVAATPATRYHIGSITKPYTATVIMRLVEEGRLTLDDTLAAYFPTIPNADGITVRQLLQHRSGINSITDDPTYLDWNAAPVSRAAMLERMAARAPRFAPDAEFGYSNSNYILLSYLVEDLTGASYAEAVEAYVLEPLGLEATRPLAAPGGEGEAASYTWAGEAGWAHAGDTDPSVPVGAGATSATAEDVARFLRGLFAGRLVGDSSLAQMIDLQDEGMYIGLGLAAMPYDGRRGYGHTGGIDGFRSQAAYWPGDSLAVAFLGNGLRVDPNDLLIAALGAYHGREVEIPDFSAREIAVDPDTLATLTGVYSSSNFPLDITLTVENGKLFGQATGQGAFPLTPMADGWYVFEMAGIRVRFPEAGTMAFEQGGMRMRFERQEKD